jgi:hypothetical protein
VPFELYYVRRAFTVMLAVLGLLAVGLTWAQVVRKISNATPPSSPVEPTSVVWGDLVFQTPHKLATWLTFHGVAYSVWSGRHPFAAGSLEHRPPAIKAQGPPAPPAAATAATTASAAHHGKQTAAAAGPRQAAAPTDTRGGSFPWKTLVVALLALLAAAATFAASAPGAFRYRYPELARTIALHRDLLLAGAAALMIGIITGVFLN